LEHQENVEELKIRRKTWSQSKLESSGTSIFHASAEPDSEVYGEKIIRIFKMGEKRLKEKFTRGDVLVLTPTPISGDRSYRNPQRNPQTIVPRECLVVDVGNDWLTLAVGPSWIPGLWETRKDPGGFTVRLDRTAPQAPLKAQKNALQRLRKGSAGQAATILAKISELGGDAIPTSEKDNQHYIDLASKLPSHLRDMVETSDNTLIQQYIDQSIAKVLGTTDFVPNEFQVEAISFALKQQISLIRGPPGTGKTRVAALLIATALKLSEQSEENTTKSRDPYRVLAVTHSNGAADVLLEALLEIGVPAVRLGRPASVSPKIQHRTVVAISERMPEVVKLRKKANNITLDRQKRVSAMFDLKSYINDIQNSIIKTAPVIVTSCIGANQLMHQGTDKSVSTFPLVVLDEAAQTTEPALVCALSAASADQVVLVGDTRQLPPTVTSTELRNNLGISPMERLEKLGVPQITLKMQYRMPDSLLQFPSKYFYDGLVSCTEELKNSNVGLPTGFPWPSSIPLAFINVGNNTEVLHNFGGKSNLKEADLVVNIVSHMLADGNTQAKDIAIITPYSKQVQIIRNSLSSGWNKIPHSELITVGTVDSFQGQETDIVIFSAVRSNGLNELGFLRDSRRLCVAITRARKGLILIGNQSCLKSCKHWSALISSCEERGCIIDGNGVYVTEDKRLLDGAKESSNTVRNNKLLFDQLSIEDLLGETGDELFGLFS
jgi:regulator of nonsense transcripts 1